MVDSLMLEFGTTLLDLAVRGDIERVDRGGKMKREMKRGMEGDYVVWLYVVGVMEWNTENYRGN